MSNEPPRVSLAAVLRGSEFRAIWVAEAQSLLGDQLARVALVVLAYERVRSPAVTGLVYALTFVPAVVGGATLSGLADRLPRRTLMIWCDLIRAVLLVAMATPGLPLAFICCLLVLAVLVGRPFAASQLALIPDLLSGESYLTGSALRLVTDQVTQLAGFASGGLIVAAIGARSALLVDAATFLLSAAIVRTFIRHRPAAGATGMNGPLPSDHSVGSALGLILRGTRLRVLLGLGCLAAFHVVPEGMAPAYAAEMGGGAPAIGVLMASLPFGTAVGASLLLRLSPARRSKLLGPLAVATSVPLIACALKPGVTSSAALWMVSGVLASYQVEASTSFVRSIPDHRKGQVIGLASSLMIAAQGLGLVAFGFVGDRWGAADAVAFAGAVAFVLAVGLAGSWYRASRIGPGECPVAIPHVAPDHGPTTNR